MEQCGAKKKNGETCRAAAGQGTRHIGTGRCKFHGGNAASGPAAGAYKHGMYAKHATPEQLADFEAWRAQGGIHGQDVPREIEWIIYRALDTLSSPGHVSPVILAEVTNKLMDALLKAQKYRGEEPATPVSLEGLDSVVNSLRDPQARAAALALERAVAAADGEGNTGGVREGG